MRRAAPSSAAALRLNLLRASTNFSNICCGIRASVVSREMLARDVWKETARATPIDNVIDVHIARLRRKIDDGFERKLLHTVRGVGFILREEPEMMASSSPRTYEPG